MINEEFVKYLSQFNTPLTESIKEGYILCESEGEQFTTIEDIPEWAVYYMVYGESDGLEDDEIAMIDDFMKENKLLRAVSTVDGTENEFCAYPAFGKACKTVNVTFATEDTGSSAIVDAQEVDAQETDADDDSNEDGAEAANVAVGMWPGHGYNLCVTEVYAPSGVNDAMAAIEIAVAQIEKDGDPNGLLLDCAEIEQSEAAEGNYDTDSGEGNEIFDEIYLYVDATMEGASKPYYILAENLKVWSI